MHENVFITKRQMNRKTSRLKDMSKNVPVTLRANFAVCVRVYQP